MYREDCSSSDPDGHNLKVKVWIRAYVSGTANVAITYWVVPVTLSSTATRSGQWTLNSAMVYSKP